MTDIVDQLYDHHVCSLAQNDCRNRHLLDRAANEITRLRALTEWQPIDTAPKDGTYILCWELDWGTELMMWLPSGWDNGDTMSRQTWPTHWMPAPRPPGTEELEG